MFISRVILFAFKNWKIASRYGFTSGVFTVTSYNRFCAAAADVNMTKIQCGGGSVADNRAQSHDH